MGDIRPVSGNSGKSWYMPHRAIILLGVLLTVVALIAATLGIVKMARAQRSLTQLSDRYLVLQPPVTDIRASIGAFQELAAQAFAGSASSPTAVSAAVADSSATSKSYLNLQRLLASNGNARLAPD